MKNLTKKDSIVSGIVAGASYAGPVGAVAGGVAGYGMGKIMSPIEGKLYDKSSIWRSYQSWRMGDRRRSRRSSRKSSRRSRSSSRRRSRSSRRRS
jgi:hypothetical protein